MASMINSNLPAVNPELQIGLFYGKK